MSSISNAFGQYASSLQLARVDEHVYETVFDDSDPESPGNDVPNGLLSVSLLSRDGPRINVPYVLPTAGSGSFVGSLPEIGSTCIVAFFEQQDPVVIGFLPPSLAHVIGKRKTLPNLQPGETMMQAGTPDADAAGNDNVFVGASIKLDKYGRVIVTGSNGEYKLTIGGLLSNEYGFDVTTLNDPITGAPIYLQETIPGGTSRRVDAQGSTVWSYGKNKVERIGGDVDSQVQGQAVTLARRGQTYQDKRGNKFGLDQDGNFFVEAGSGAMSFSSQGDARYETAGNESRMTSRGFKHVVAGNHTTTVGSSMNVVIGQAPNPTNPGSALSGETKVVLGLGGSSETLVMGAKQILAALGFNFFAGPVPPAGIPAIGLPGSMIFTATLLAKLTAPLVMLGPVGADPVVTVSTLLAFMNAFIPTLSAAFVPLGPSPIAQLNALIALAGSKTLLGSP